MNVQEDVFLSINRNKRSIAIDLKSAEGLVICHRLAMKADVVIERFAASGAVAIGAS